MQERVFIAGAGPVGLVAAANLVHRGVLVTVFEAGATLSEESRASTFHPPTLDMLDTFGVTAPLIAQGLQAPRFQFRSQKHGLLAEFDFSAIADATGNPYRVQCEQSKLTRILLDQLGRAPNFQIEFGSAVQGVTQDNDSVEIAIERNGRNERRRARWLIGADGARSDVRRSLGIEFQGFTWPERFLVISTPFDFGKIIPGLVEVCYVADPQRWHFLLQIPGLCRVMFPIAAHESDELALSPAFAQSLMATIVPGLSDYEIAHVTLYRVHQRVAKIFALGRTFLVGDAAHINNPLGGMGMNGGIHDAINLTERLAQVWHVEAGDGELDRYDGQRRLVTLEYVQKHSIQNKRNLEASDPAEQARFRDELRTIAGDAGLRHDYLLRISMIASLKRAAELG